MELKKDTPTQKTHGLNLTWSHSLKLCISKVVMLWRNLAMIRHLSILIAPSAFRDHLGLHKLKRSWEEILLIRMLTSPPKTTFIEFTQLIQYIFLRSTTLAKPLRPRHACLIASLLLRISMMILIHLTLVRLRSEPLRWRSRWCQDNLYKSKQVTISLTSTPTMKLVIDVPILTKLPSNGPLTTPTPKHLIDITNKERSSSSVTTLDHTTQDLFGSGTISHTLITKTRLKHSCNPQWWEPQPTI